jgi:Protein of unknown function (DUF1329)
MNKIVRFAVLFVITVFMSQPALAIDPYPIDETDVKKYKDITDDPRPIFDNTKDHKVWIPDEAWSQITYDIDEMKRVWSECVGFKAPDVVGKVAPEIKPGKYTLADKTKLPFDKLMNKWEYARWNKPGDGLANHIGNYTEIEIVPTRQYYWALPVAEATLKYAGKTKQDDAGYILDETYSGGLPFPKPSGKHKGIQIIYNYERRYEEGEDALLVDLTIGVDKNWNHDHTGAAVTYMLRTKGRVVTPPFGLLDKRAAKQRELKTTIYTLSAPRDYFGNVYSITSFTDPNKSNMILAYVNILRRIRKLSSSDKQDQAVGQDITFDDAFGWSQAISPKIYPFEYRVIEEREFLVPALSLDGAEYTDSKDKYSLKTARFERRPCWVVECKQLDSNYIYSKRVVTVDKETLNFIYHEMYDQKERLYRGMMLQFAFLEPMGLVNPFYILSGDFIDVHSTLSYDIGYPALWVDRNETSLRNLMKAK